MYNLLANVKQTGGICSGLGEGNWERKNRLKYYPQLHCLVYLEWETVDVSWIFLALTVNNSFGLLICCFNGVAGDTLPHSSSLVCCLSCSHITFERWNNLTPLKSHLSNNINHHILLHSSASFSSSFQFIHQSWTRIPSQCDVDVDTIAFFLMNQRLGPLKTI